MAELNIVGVKAIGYTPSLNITEQYWRVVKRAYKFQLFKFLTRHPARELNLFQMVEDLMNGPMDIDPKKSLD
jgi:hypothetical protein